MTSKTFKTRRTNITPNPDGVLSGSDMSLLGCQRENYCSLWYRPFCRAGWNAAGPCWRTMKRPAAFAWWLPSGLVRSRLSPFRMEDTNNCPIELEVLSLLSRPGVQSRSDTSELQTSPSLQDLFQFNRPQDIGSVTWPLSIHIARGSLLERKSHKRHFAFPVPYFSLSDTRVRVLNS